MPRRRKDLNGSNSTTSRGLQHLHRQITTKEKPQQRNAANARERARMRVLSRAFCRLKTTLPWVPADTKLSKLDTLRLATTYIGHLRTVLVEGSSERTSPLPTARPVMSWPFMFNKCGSGPSDPSTSELDSPTSTIDDFSLHECLPEETIQRRLQDKSQTHHSMTTVDSSYQLSRYPQNTLDYCNLSLPDGLNYCNDAPLELH